MRIGPSFSIARSLLAFRQEQSARRINTNRNQKNGKWPLKKIIYKEKSQTSCPIELVGVSIQMNLRFIFTPGNKLLHLWLVMTIFQMGGSYRPWMSHQFFIIYWFTSIHVHPYPLFKKFQNFYHSLTFTLISQWPHFLATDQTLIKFHQNILYSLHYKSYFSGIV